MYSRAAKLLQLAKELNSSGPVEPDPKYEETNKAQCSYRSPLRELEPVMATNSPEENRIVQSKVESAKRNIFKADGDELIEADNDAVRKACKSSNLETCASSTLTSSETLTTRRVELCKSNTHTTAEDCISESSRGLDGVDSDNSLADPNFEDLSVTESEDSMDENDQQIIEKPKKKRANAKKWKRNIDKQKRHSGAELLTNTGRLVKKKVLKNACCDTCRLKCKWVINDKLRLNILETFWSDNKSIDTKRQFIASHVVQVPVKSRRGRNGARQGKRQHTNKYFFEKDGKRVAVCKKFFLSTLAISQQTVDTAIGKKRCGGMVSPDKRGKHVPTNKISDDIRNNVRNHISLFPTYTSHYSRERSKKRYLGSHLNITRMYKLYLEDCEEKCIPKESVAKEWLYHEIFNYEFNYAFKLPANDTCDMCDKFQLQLQEADCQDSRRELQQQYDRHLEDASNRYKMKSEDKTRSRSSTSEKVIMIDLEKCLPTPELTNSQSFYSLKLWTYNLVIHDSTSQISHCMMWDESVAGRGGNEIASCLVKWAEVSNIPDSVQELTIWSDNCPSQNRNILIVMCYFWILKLRPNLQVINHKFLTRGHTHLEADVDHSLIERERKKLPQFRIIVPWDWQQIVRICSTKKPFNVFGMESDHFLNFKKLYEGPTSPFILKKKTNLHEDFLISRVVHLQVRREQFGILRYTEKFDETFKEIDFNRRSTRHVGIPDELQVIQSNPRRISTKKYNNLQKLLPWIPKAFHYFYKTLPHGAQEDEDSD